MEIKQPFYVHVRSGLGMGLREGKYVSMKGLSVTFYDVPDKDPNHLVASFFMTPDAFKEMAGIFSAVLESKPELFRTNEAE